MARKIEYQRYYYSKDILYEKSLDIYKPVAGNHSDNETTKVDVQQKPIIILVVGSGWTGHQPFIYRLCSWWNSSGPKAIAGLGYVCVCIRHRGAFPALFAQNTKNSTKINDNVSSSSFCGTATSLIVTMGLIHSLVFSSLVFGDQDSNQGYSHDLAVFLFVAAMLSCLSVSVYLLLQRARKGCATLDDMLQDVLEALAWVHDPKNKKLYDKHNNNSNDPAPPPLVFGGYSSGGHIAATLLQRPQLFSSRGLPVPEQFFSAALLLSGVLAVRPTSTDNIASLLQKHHPPNEAPAISSSPSNVPPSPRWFTDLVMHTVWGGEEEARRIPSPLDGLLVAAKKDNTTTAVSSIPHLLIGCKHEMFGIPWLDLFFCSKQYHLALQNRGVPSKFVRVDSDHWSVLNSTALRDALEHELEQITISIATGNTPTTKTTRIDRDDRAIFGISSATNKNNNKNNNNNSGSSNSSTASTKVSPFLSMSSSSSLSSSFDQTGEKQ